MNGYRDIKQLISNVLLLNEQLMRAGQDVLEPVASWYVTVAALIEVGLPLLGTISVCAIHLQRPLLVPCSEVQDSFELTARALTLVLCRDATA